MPTYRSMLKTCLTTSLRSSLKYRRPPLPSADKALKSLRGSVLGHQRAVDRVKSSLDAEVQRSKTDFDAKAKQANDTVVKLEQDASSVENKYTKLDKDIQDFMSQQQTAFSTAETKRSESFSLLLTNEAKKLEQDVDKMAKSSEERISELSKNTEEDRQKAQESKEKIEKILGIVGEEALIGQYSKNAGDDKKDADSWRNYTAVAIGCAILIALWLALTITVQDEANWYRIAAKALLTLSFGGLAFYTSRQSAEHRKAQRDAEQMALQLAALSPYLSNIEDINKRDELLADLAKKLFGQSSTQVTRRKSKKAEPNAGDPNNLLSQVLTLMQELAKKIPS